MQEKAWVNFQDEQAEDEIGDEIDDECDEDSDDECRNKAMI